jgi:poly(3-hydroxybutyrate) depolymerase
MRRWALWRGTAPAGKSARFQGLALRLAAALALLLPLAEAEAAKILIRVETPGGVEQKVYLARPVGLATDRPVVFVMHGAERNADLYRDQWYDLAEEHDFLVVAPEFSEADFPGADGYDFGNVYDRQGGVRPKSIWAFEAIESIFDDVRRRFGMTAEGYSLYGRSAGARFAQLFLLHVPGARVDRAVVANAERYTMPDFALEFPGGLCGSAVGRDELGRALQLPLTVLLGDADPEPHAQAFFDAARAAAVELKVPFGWRLAAVPGAGHDTMGMARAAIPYLLP